MGKRKINKQKKELKATQDFIKILSKPKEEMIEDNKTKAFKEFIKDIEDKTNNYMKRLAILANAEVGRLLLVLLNEFKATSEDRALLQEINEYISKCRNSEVKMTIAMEFISLVKKNTNFVTTEETKKKIDLINDLVMCTTEKTSTYKVYRAYLTGDLDLSQVALNYAYHVFNYLPSIWKKGEQFYFGKDEFGNSLTIDYLEAIRNYEVVEVAVDRNKDRDDIFITEAYEMSCYRMGVLALTRNNKKKSPTLTVKYAENALRYFFKINPETPFCPVNFYIAECAFRMGNLKFAEAKLKYHIAHYAKDEFKAEAAYLLMTEIADIKSNPSEYKKYFDIAYKYKHPEVTFLYAMALCEKNKEEEAFAVLTQECVATHPTALFVLGKLYLTGVGTEIDIKKGLECLQIAAQFHQCYAATELCQIYHDGKYNQKVNLKLANDYLKQATRLFKKELTKTTNEEEKKVCYEKLGDLYSMDSDCIQFAQIALDYYILAVKGINIDDNNFNDANGLRDKIKHLTLILEKENERDKSTPSLGILEEEMLSLNYVTLVEEEIKKLGINQTNLEEQYRLLDEAKKDANLYSEIECNLNISEYFYKKASAFFKGDAYHVCEGVYCLEQATDNLAIAKQLINENKVESNTQVDARESMNFMNDMLKQANLLLTDTIAEQSAFNEKCKTKRINARKSIIKKFGLKGEKAEKGEQGWIKDFEPTWDNISDDARIRILTRDNLEQLINIHSKIKELNGQVQNKHAITLTDAKNRQCKIVQERKQHSIFKSISANKLRDGFLQNDKKEWRLKN